MKIAALPARNREANSGRTCNTQYWEKLMTYFKHTEEHEIDCNCSYCMDVDLDKSIAREIERVI